MTLPKERSPLITQFLEFIKELGYASFPTYKSQIKALERWLWRRRIPLDRLTFAHLADFIAMRKTARNTHLSLERTLSVLRKFCRFAHDRNLLPLIPADHLFVSWIGAPGNYPAYQGAFKTLFSAAHNVRRYAELPFAEELGEFALMRKAQGYTGGKLRFTLWANHEFQNYLAERGKRNLNDVTPSDVDHFLKTAPNTKLIKEDMRSDIVYFMEFVYRRLGQYFLPRKYPFDSNSGWFRKVMRRYLDFSRAHRGVSEATLRAAIYHLKFFDDFLAKKGIQAARDITVAHLDEFLTKFPRYNPRGLSRINSILKSLLKFLYLHGHLPRDLSCQLYSPSCFSKDLRPKYLRWDQVQEFLASIDRTTPVGKRRYALFILMASYGLRLRELARLSVEDFNFAEHSFRIPERKSKKTAVFPLRPGVEEAIKDFLRIRPASSHPHLFVNLRAPFKPLDGRSLCNMISSDLREALGRILPKQGSTTLRHSFAKAMLDRGAPLTDIGAVLGHRSLRSTLIYTRVATEDLRDVAANYGDLL